MHLNLPAISSTPGNIFPPLLARALNVFNRNEINFQTTYEIFSSVNKTSNGGVFFHNNEKYTMPAIGLLLKYCLFVYLFRKTIPQRLEATISDDINTK